MHAVSSQTELAERVPRISEQSISDLFLLLVCRPDRAIAIGWWRLLGKKVRARGRLEAALTRLPLAEQRRTRRLGREDADKVTAARASGKAASFAIHLHIGEGDRAGAVRSAIEAISKQSEAPLQVTITSEHNARTPKGLDCEQTANRAEGFLLALDKASEGGCDWIVPLTSSIRLPRHALAAYGAFWLELENPDDVALLYGDEEDISRPGSLKRAWLKPLWDPRMALSQDYVSPSCAIRVAPALSVIRSVHAYDIAGLYEIILRLAKEGEVRHLDRFTARTPRGHWRSRGPETLAAVERVEGDAAASISPGPFGTVDLRWPLAHPVPMVSVIVATRDRVELLRTCAEGVLNDTDYPNLEFIIADNESIEPETLAYMEELAADPRVSVVRWPHPFNYSAINNFGAAHARGEYLCLLNNDIEVIEPDWLTTLVREAERPGVGAVGARLYYPDRSIQHAGVAIGIGNAAGHAHRALPGGEPGYYAQALIARGASAVTGACLLVSKRDFDAVGGLDEEHLAVAYNDVDLCLKLRERGLSNIYAPAAELIHHESKSRGLDFAPEHLARYMAELEIFQERWETTSKVDPWHHSRLDRGSEIF